MFSLPPTLHISGSRALAFFTQNLFTSLTGGTLPQLTLSKNATQFVLGSAFISSPNQRFSMSLQLTLASTFWVAKIEFDLLSEFAFLYVNNIYPPNCRTIRQQASAN